MRRHMDVEDRSLGPLDLLDHREDAGPQVFLRALPLRVPRRLVRPPSRQDLDTVELDDPAFEQLIDVEGVVVPGRGEALYALLGEPRAGELDPLFEPALDEGVEELLPSHRVIPELLELRFGHHLRVKAHVGDAGLEHGDLFVAAQPRVLAGKRAQI